ncbi:MAG: arginine--tRNA ligase [Oligoflexales bacterium]|nr:arginine--tRNA ligase [Oligoflexales bacterium]
MTSPRDLDLEKQSLDPLKKKLADFIFQSLSELAELNKDQNINSATIFQSLEKPKDPQHGDFALPCFRYAKTTHQKPEALASLLAEKLKTLPDILQTNAIGAFLNIKMTAEAFQNSVFVSIEKKELFKPDLPSLKKQSTMVEYSQPNTHKEFHVGHLRNVCLGASLVEMMRYMGIPVVAANYIGDEGAHIAKCLWQYDALGKKPDNIDKNTWLAHCYVHANQLLEGGKDAKDGTAELQHIKNQEQISAILRAIENKTGKFFDLWQETRQWSLDEFNRIYEQLGVKFDHFFFESETSEASQAIVEEYLKSGLFEISEGAVGLNLDAYKMGYLILRKTDGNTLYATKDLALAKIKFHDFKINTSIYIVASEQKHHFRQVFKTLELMGFEQAKNCYHLSYGTVVRPDGKMSSRKGNSFTYTALFNEVEQSLLQYMVKYQDSWSEAEIKDCTRLLTLGTIKYGMLRSDPVGDIIFDLPDWLSFEGNTGPYLMYSYARANSILRKASEQSIAININNKSHHKEETSLELIRLIYDFNLVVLEATQLYKPSILAAHLYALAKAFNRFYIQVPILKEKELSLVKARLNLVNAYKQTIYVGLGLLGIIPPEKM